jgi:threonine dehydrogenase-like Zn-dependent dehydrogenase
VPEADGTLVVISESLADASRDLDVLPLGDVFSTGYHGVVNAGVRPGDTVAALGDGAAGICAVQAATLFGTATIIQVGHHDDRLAIGTSSGATQVVNAKAQDAVETIKNLTHGRGTSAARWRT